MGARTAETKLLRYAIESHRAEFDAVLARYGAKNPRIFGSVARGDATAGSDIDVLVDLDVRGDNLLLRVAGLGEELSDILGVRVDVVTGALLREPVSAAALAEAVPL